MGDMPYISCDIGVYKDKTFILGLDSGMQGVSKFYKLANDGIVGARTVEKSFSYNVDVTIAGSDLLIFIDKEYPAKMQSAKEIIALEDLYTIICYDMS